jgi:hypothetical protein
VTAGRSLRGLWPALPALLILWLGGASFLEKYPRPAQGQRSHVDAAGGPDTLMAMVRAEMAEADLAADSILSAEDASPFRPIRPPRPVARSGGMQVPPPQRNYHLKGTVGNRVATIVNLAGARMIVKVGERVDSAEVVSIEPNKVILKDRAGRFELLLEN